MVSTCTTHLVDTLQRHKEKNGRCSKGKKEKSTSWSGKRGTEKGLEDERRPGRVYEGRQGEVLSRKGEVEGVLSYRRTRDWKVRQGCDEENKETERLALEEGV